MPNSRGNFRDRDEYGRFTSDDDNRSRRSYRDDDDDRYYSRNGNGSEGRGWYGESERHSEAARHGRSERGSGSRSDHGFDDQSRSMRNRYGAGNENTSYVNSERGRYADRDYDRDRDRGYSSRNREDQFRDESYSSRYGRGAVDEGREWYGYDDRSERMGREPRESGGSYRYGRDTEGRGWEDRDGTRYSSREGNRSADRGGRDGDGRGWYGDSEGHSRAARRGWQDR